MTCAAAKAKIRLMTFLQKNVVEIERRVEEEVHCKNTRKQLACTC